MCKDWKKELEEYIARIANKQHLSDNFYIAMASPEFKAKVAAGQLGKKKPPRSASHSAKQRAAHMGQDRSEETRAKISSTLTGIKRPPRSDSHSAKIAAANMGVPQLIVTCPHCGKEGGARAMKRHHFDNCKLKRD
jgi:hypothetical protein